MTQQPYTVIDHKWNTVQNPSAPTRAVPDSAPAGPDPKARRADAPPFSRGDLEFPHRHAMSPPASYLITVTTKQLELAGNEPTQVWPAYPVHVRR